MKKIALCFSGQLRGHYKLTNHWIHNVIIPLQNICDVTLFFYVCDDVYFSKTWKDIKKTYSKFNINVVVKKEIDKNFNNIVPDIFNLIPSGLPYGHNQLIREHYFMDSVIKLKSKYEIKNKFKFDYVIRTRPDCLPEKFNLDLLNLVQNNFCISDHDHHDFINARFTICNSKISDTIFTLLDNYKNTIKKLPKPEPVYGKPYDPNKRYFAGEQFWQTHLSLFDDIDIELIPFRVYLVRDYDAINELEQGNIFLNGQPVARFNENQEIPLNII